MGRTNWNTIQTLAGYLWPKNRSDLKIRVVFALVSLAMVKVINVTLPFFLKNAVDSFEKVDLTFSIPMAFILGFTGGRLLHQIFSELRDLAFENVSQFAQRAVGLDTFKHLHSLSLRFHLERQTGGLSRIIERGVSSIRFVLRFMLFNILPTLLELALVAGILYRHFGPSYAGIILGVVVFYIWFTFSVTNWRLKFRKRMNAKDSEANTKAIDSLLNFETVKYFSNEEHEYDRYNRSLEQFEKSAIQSQGSLSLLNFGQQLIIQSGACALLLMVTYGVVEGRYTVGDLVLINSFLVQLFQPLNFLGFVYREIRQSLIDMEKMFDILTLYPEIKDEEDAKDLVIESSNISFKNVSFYYDSQRAILKDVSFDVPSGKTIAVVGPSGSGKSTLTRLLFRFYDVQKGSILIDGQDIKKIKQKSLRANLGVVPQDTVLFNDSISYNIAYGSPKDATDESIWKAADMAQIGEFIRKLPEKMKTQVGERGLKLSGGEKQRVAIARTILKNPPILIFDEATSALDSKTERYIQASIESVSQGKTTLIIAHRLSTIIHADEIIVLKEGQIVERGSHSHLLEMEGEYARMWEQQEVPQPA